MYDECKTMPTKTTTTTTAATTKFNLQVDEYTTLFKDSRFDILRDCARDGKLEEDWLWQLAANCIHANDLEGMKKLHEVFGYEWWAPFGYQTLLQIASSYATDDDTRVFEYMLETGACLYEYDYSEDWNEWEFEVRNVIEEGGEKWYGVETIEVIKWGIEQGADTRALYEKMRWYEK